MYWLVFPEDRRLLSRAHDAGADVMMLYRLAIAYARRALHIPLPGKMDNDLSGASEQDETSWRLSDDEVPKILEGLQKLQRGGNLWSDEVVVDELDAEDGIEDAEDVEDMFGANLNDPDVEEEAMYLAALEENEQDVDEEAMYLAALDRGEFDGDEEAEYSTDTGDEELDGDEESYET
jgi:hypothetical protein